jgi:hypothetical protein
MPAFRIQDVDNECIDKYPVGLPFWEIYNGYTKSGYGQVSKQWEIVEIIGDGYYLCKPLTDNTVVSLNMDYREKFSASQIEKILLKTPIVNR